MPAPAAGPAAAAAGGGGGRGGALAGARALAPAPGTPFASPGLGGRSCHPVEGRRSPLLSGDWRRPRCAALGKDLTACRLRAAAPRAQLPAPPHCLAAGKFQSCRSRARFAVVAPSPELRATSRGSRLPGRSRADAPDSETTCRGD